MRKLMIASLMTSAVAVAAHAGSISFDSRFDYEAKNYNTDAGKPNYNRFNVQTMRVDAKGNFDEATSYRLRFRLNGTLNAARTADSMDNRTDFAYVQRKLMDGLTLQLGKIGTDIGGFEGMTSGADLYMNSASYTDQSVLRYATGAKLTYTMADQEFNLMTVNQQADVTGETGNFNQTNEAMGLVYKGSFMDKALLPYVGYFMDKVSKTPTTTDVQKNDYMNVGLKWDAKPVFVEADYSANTYKDKYVNEKDTTTSMVATVGYQMDNWVAKLKYEGSEKKEFSAPNTSIKTTYTGMQLAAEYMPTGEKNFRYHVAYTTRDTKADTAGAKTSTEQVVYAGVKLYADFLK